MPSANFRNTTYNRGQAISIGGLGTISTSLGVEASVSTVIDGLVLARLDKRYSTRSTPTASRC